MARKDLRRIVVVPVVRDVHHDIAIRGRQQIAERVSRGTADADGAAHSNLKHLAEKRGNRVEDLMRFVVGDDVAVYGR